MKLKKYQEGTRQSAALIPWQRDVSGAGEREGKRDELEAGLEEEVQEKGLLEEIESLCHLSSSLHTSLELTQVHNNTDES